MPKGKYRKKKSKPPNTALPPAHLSIGEAQESRNNEGTKKEEEKDMPNTPSYTYRWIAKNIMEILTGLILVTYITSDYFLWKQFNLADTSARVDQRAWISVSIPESFHPQDGPLSVPLRIVNSGKTPAKKFIGNIRVEVLNRGEDPHFTYDNDSSWKMSSGTILPNLPVTETFTAPSHQKMFPETIIMTENNFWVIHARVTYADIFGKDHWLTFCNSGGNNRLVGSKACAEYNNVDNN